MPNNNMDQGIFRGLLAPCDVNQVQIMFLPAFFFQGMLKIIYEVLLKSKPIFLEISVEHEKSYEELMYSVLLPFPWESQSLVEAYFFHL
jgi:hypothetical protein